MPETPPITAAPARPGVAARVLAAAFAVAVAGAAGNTAACLSPAPRALASFGALLGPVAAAGVALFVVALVLLPAAALVLRRWASSGAAMAATGTALVAGVTLWPLAGGAAASGAERALWAAATGGLALGVLGIGRSLRCRAAARARALLLLGVPVAALLVLAASWARTYSPVGTPLEVACGTLALLVLGGAWRVLPAVPALPILFALAGATTAAGLGGLLRGDGDLRIHHARTLPDGHPSPVVLITVDTLRPDFLSHAREDGADTPAMDALFADSVVFTHARSSAPWTKPSVATILTGLSPIVHGTTSPHVRLPEEVHTLAEHMQSAGYATAGMGLNVHLEARNGFGQGFDQYRFPVRDEWGDSLGSALLRRVAPARFPAIFPTTEELGDVAVQWIRDNTDRDFFLWVHFLDPHWPYEPPPPYLPPREKGQRIGDRWGDEETVTAVQSGRLKLGDADKERVRELYKGEIEYVDANVGRIVQALRDAGLYDKALIAFTSDHGEEFWEHGRYEHGHTLYDELLHIPLAFKLPGESVREHVDAPVTNEALVPTVLELAAVPELNPMTSRSLVRFWNGGDTEPDDHLAAGTYYYAEKRMLLHDGMKAIIDLGTGTAEVYDLTVDPGEKRPLGADDPRVAPLLGRLKERVDALEALRAKLGIRATAVEADAGAAARLGALGYGQGKVPR